VWWREQRRAADSSFAQSRRDDELLLRFITFGLFDGLLRISHQHEINYLAALMKISLMSIIEKFGMEFERLGDIVEYHGLRQPCFAVLNNLIERSRMERTPLWQFVNCRDADYRGFGLR
jgi:N-acyl amino acid synthase of PEP-CTERM/exosortase system